MDIFVKMGMLDGTRLGEFFVNVEPAANIQLIGMISSGNVLTACTSVTKYASANSQLHVLVVNWARLLFEKIVKDSASDNCNEYWIANACELLGCILTERKFVIGTVGLKLLGIVSKFAKQFTMLSLTCDKNIAVHLHVTICSAILIEEFLSTPPGCVLFDSNEDSKSELDTMPGNRVSGRSLSSSLDQIEEKDKIDVEVEDTDEDLLMQPHLMYDETEATSSDELMDSSKDDTAEHHVDVEEVAKMKMQFIGVLLNNSKLLLHALLGKTKDGQFPPELGRFRFSLVKIISCIVLLNIPELDEQLFQTQWINACLDLFFHYQRHSILHETVRKMFHSIGARRNTYLFEQILTRTDFLERLATYLPKKGPRPPNYGHLIVIIHSITKHDIGKKILSSSPHEKTLIKLAK